MRSNNQSSLFIGNYKNKTLQEKIDACNECENDYNTEAPENRHYALILLMDALNELHDVIAQNLAGNSPDDEYLQFVQVNATAFNDRKKSLQIEQSLYPGILCAALSNEWIRNILNQFQSLPDLSPPPLPSQPSAPSSTELSTKQDSNQTNTLRYAGYACTAVGLFACIGGGTVAALGKKAQNEAIKKATLTATDIATKEAAIESAKAFTKKGAMIASTGAATTAVGMLTIANSK